MVAVRCTFRRPISCQSSLWEDRTQQLQRIAHSTLLGNGNRIVVEFAEALARAVPVDEPRILFASGGACAVEQALKIAFQYWKTAELAEKGVRVQTVLPGATPKLDGKPGSVTVLLFVTLLLIGLLYTAYSLTRDVRSDEQNESC